MLQIIKHFVIVMDTKFMMDQRLSRIMIMIVNKQVRRLEYQNI